MSRSVAVIAGAATLSLALAACTPATAPAAHTSSTHQADSGLPNAHVHGLSVSSDTSRVLVATHEELFDVTTRPATKIGGTNDLMGFTTGKDNGVFYASGHPGEGSDLPNPLGLIRSVDGGKPGSSSPGRANQTSMPSPPPSPASSHLTAPGELDDRAGLHGPKKGRIEGKVLALAAVMGVDGKPRIWAVTRKETVVSTDGGSTFRLADTAWFTSAKDFAGTLRRAAAVNTRARRSSLPVVTVQVGEALSAASSGRWSLGPAPRPFR